MNFLNKIELVDRDAINTISSITIAGVVYNLGIHKDFRRNEILKDFLPENCRLSMAWVHLKSEEKLEAHDHPIETMIIVCKGQGHMFGDRIQDIKEGDVILIPRGKRHGFIGTGKDGYWALSIQLEKNGLYENPESALVEFNVNKNSSPFQRLLEQNEKQMKDHLNNGIFKLIQSRDIENSKIRNKLLDCIQVWSNVYQNVVMSRYILTSDQRFQKIAMIHLLEEFGHNRSLEQSREGKLKPVNDPALVAISEWFVYKMQTFSDIEKLVMIHLVLEGGGKIFHTIADPIMKRFHETNHFEVHNEADDGHMTMGHPLISNIDLATLSRLSQVLDQGWNMLNALCERMAELSLLEKSYESHSSFGK